MKSVNHFSVYSLVLIVFLLCYTSVYAKDKELLRENYTKIINDGDGELRVAIVYYNVEEGELFQ